MKKFLATILSFLCLFFVSCGSTQEINNGLEQESPSNNEQSTDTETSSTDSTSEDVEPEPTTRQATLDDFVLISFNQTNNNCIVKFSVSDDITDCILTFELYDKVGTTYICSWWQHYYFTILPKNQIEEFKFAFYEDTNTKNVIFEQVRITVVRGTIELD